MPRVDNNARSLLLALGMGDFNATGCIPWMFVAPAQLDADMPAMILMVEHIQKALNQMGAQLPVNGDLDVATVIELKKVVGPNWLPMKMYDIIRRIVRARNAGFRIRPGEPVAQHATTVAAEAELELAKDGGMGWTPSFSDTTTWIVGGAAALAIFLFGSKRRAARKAR